MRVAFFFLCSTVLFTKAWIKGGPETVNNSKAPGEGRISLELEAFEA